MPLFVLSAGVEEVATDHFKLLMAGAQKLQQVVHVMGNGF